jgi:aspartyl-tRNA(Asn)/glutamyl-tRNA(Gln) amidotransferase subunit B
MGGATGRIHGADYSLVDYNRAGIPLVEIVTKPIEGTGPLAPVVAHAYVTELRDMLRSLVVSDVRMEEGSLRCDVNTSLSPRGSGRWGTRTETKNVNSLRSVEQAVHYEIERQAAVLDAGERVIQETRHFHEDSGITTSGRSKEEAQDYRYFPEPDLVPLAPDAAQRARAGASVPELPAPRRARLVADWGISDADARVLVDVDGLADYAEGAVAELVGGTPRDVAHWCTVDVLAFLRESGLPPSILPLPPDGLAELVGLVADGTLSRRQAKDVLDECLREPKRPRQVVAERGLAQVSDEAELAGAVDGVVAAHPDEVTAYRGGDEKERAKKLGFLMGEAMRATGGQGNPRLVRALLEDRLG